MIETNSQTSSLGLSPIRALEMILDCIRKKAQLLALKQFQVQQPWCVGSRKQFDNRLLSIKNHLPGLRRAARAMKSARNSLPEELNLDTS
jgi:hypothetical protein